jgi:prepilin-type N-terminal cleavage/methylation domain-containing protein
MPSSIKRSATPGSPPGLTLVELLVVTAILGLLAAMLLPAVARTKTSVKTQRARLEMSGLISAITEYESTYARYPISDEAVSAVAPFNEDLTYGGVIEETHTWIAGPGPYLTNNCELIAVLLDLQAYGDGAPTINDGHCKNPRRTRFLQANAIDGTNALPGVGVDGVFRDPWKSPYMITLDLNHDGRARDFMCREPAVSEDPLKPGLGLKGLVRAVDTEGRVFFEAPGPIMVWSAGPDRKVNTCLKANQGVNRDNLLSWNLR